MTSSHDVTHNHCAKHSSKTVPASNHSRSYADLHFCWLGDTTWLLDTGHGEDTDFRLFYTKTLPVSLIHKADFMLIAAKVLFFNIKQCVMLWMIKQRSMSQIYSSLRVCDCSWISIFRFFVFILVLLQNQNNTFYDKHVLL